MENVLQIYSKCLIYSCLLKFGKKQKSTLAKIFTGGKAGKCRICLKFSVVGKRSINMLIFNESAGLQICDQTCNNSSTLAYIVKLVLTDSFDHVYEGSYKGAKIYFCAHLLKIAKVCKQVPLHLFAKDRKGVQTSALCIFARDSRDVQRNIFGLISWESKDVPRGVLPNFGRYSVGM